MTARLDGIVAHGYAPWQPCRAASEPTVLHFYDMPLAGVVKVGDDFVAFQCLSGPELEISLWAYVRLSEDPTGAIDKLQNENPTAVYAWLDGAFIGKEAIFAIARASRISLWTRQEVADRLDKAATEAVVTLRSPGRTTSRQDAELAHEATTELLTLA